LRFQNPACSVGWLQAGKSLACLHSKDEEAIGVVHLDTYPAESMSTDTGEPWHILASSSISLWWN
jgi:hypothetical protein